MNQEAARRWPKAQAREPLVGVAVLLKRHAALLIILSSLCLNLALMIAPGWEQDLYWHDVWLRESLKTGVPSIPEKVWCDYPPGYLYLLKLVGWAWVSVAGPLPEAGTITMRYLLKLMPLLGNLAGSLLLYWIASRQVKRSTALVVLAGYAFNPALLFNSAVWGQADSVLSVLVLLAAHALLSGYAFWGFAAYAVVILIKFQAVVVLPLLVYAVWLRKGFPGLVRAYFGLLATAGIILLPSFMAGKVEWVVKTALGASGRYPMVSMNAANIWWLYGKEASPTISDGLRFGNSTLSFYSLGMVMFCAATVLILLRVRATSGLAEPRVRGEFYAACALQFLAFYLFPTQMHERYIVPAVIFLAAAAIYNRFYWPFYALLSLTVCWSLASTLKANYVDGLGWLGKTLDALGLGPRLLPASRGDMMVASCLVIGTFVVLLYFVRSRKYALTATAWIAGITLGVGLVAFSPRHNDVLLSDWDPVITYQGWGKLMRNKSVLDERLEPHGYIFKRGIGTHTWSWLKYHVNEQFDEFETCYGIDYPGCQNQVFFRIQAEYKVEDGYDRRTLHESKAVTPGDIPHYVRVSIKGAEFLILEVTEGDDGRNCDHVAWLNPVLIRGK